MSYKNENVKEEKPTNLESQVTRAEYHWKKNDFKTKKFFMNAIEHCHSKNCEMIFGSNKATDFVHIISTTQEDLYCQLIDVKQYNLKSPVKFVPLNQIEMDAKLDIIYLIKRISDNGWEHKLYYWRDFKYSFTNSQIKNIIASISCIKKIFIQEINQNEIVVIVGTKVNDQPVLICIKNDIAYQYFAPHFNINIGYYSGKQIKEEENDLEFLHKKFELWEKNRKLGTPLSII